MFNTDLTAITSASQFTELGIDNVFGFNSSNYLTVLGLQYSQFGTTSTYYTTELETGLILLLKRSDYFTSPSSNALYAVLYDKDNSVVFIIDGYSCYGYNLNYSDYYTISNLTSSDNLSDIYPEYESGSDVYMSSLPGSDNYLYCNFQTGTGTTTDKFCLLYGVSGGVVNTSVLNTNIQMSNGDILIPLYSNYSYLSYASTSRPWICAIKKA